MKKRAVTVLVWAALVTAAVLLAMRPSEPKVTFLPFPEFHRLVEAKLVAEVELGDGRLEATLRNGAHVATVGTPDDALYDALEAQDVPISSAPRDAGGGWGPSQLLPWLLGLAAVVALIFFLRRNNVNIVALRRSRHRVVTEETGARFADVGGCDEAKRQLGDIVDFLANPKRWTAAGVRAPRGIRLEGPPGCGKTLLARAVAGETKARFLTVSASEFVELFIGVGAARVRDLFESAAKQAPAVIFIDELDAIGRRRGSGIGYANDEREATLNQLLVSLDGFRSNDRVVVIAATNRADILDPALVRAGRFDRRVRVSALSRGDRLRVLEIHCRAKPLASDVSLEALADHTDGFTGADLETLANEAALLAVRRARDAGDSTNALRADDFARALAQRAQTGRLAPLDSALVDSSYKLTEPVGGARLRVTLDDGSAVDGDLVWADGSFLKVRQSARDGQRAEAEVVIAKRRVRILEALDVGNSAEPPKLRLTGGSDAGRSG